METFNKEKFKTLIHFICSRCGSNPSRLGATKLNKLLWYIEVLSFLRTGKPMTGVKFIKRQYGPVPLSVQQVIAELQQESVLFVKDTEFFGKPKREYISLKEPSLNEMFSAEDIVLIDQLILNICDKHTAKSISELSHNSAWHSAQIGEYLPLFTCLSVPGEVSEEDMEWAGQRISEMQSGAATLN